MDKYWELMTKGDDPKLSIYRELVNLYEELDYLRWIRSKCQTE